VYHYAWGLSSLSAHLPALRDESHSKLPHYASLWNFLKGLIVAIRYGLTPYWRGAILESTPSGLVRNGSGCKVKASQLRNILEAHELSVRRAAEELGIHERTLHRYLAGEASIPKLVQVAMRAVIAEFAHPTRKV
jgi:transcriptional regulator of acetoin/glycerol metabolism